MKIPKSQAQFKESLSLEAPPREWPEALQSIWYDVKGDWEAAHNIAQDMPSTMGSWLHAYLHRKEGDNFNARYWYLQANKVFPTLSLEEEQKAIVAHLIS